MQHIIFFSFIAEQILRFTNEDKVTSLSFKFTFLIFGFSLVVLPKSRPKISGLTI